MVRITQTDSLTLTTFSLDGKLLGPWVDELRQVIASVRAKDAVRLNLEHLRYADAAGIELLRIVRSAGVQLVGVSPLMEGLLATRQESVATSEIAGARE